MHPTHDSHRPSRPETFVEVLRGHTLERPDQPALTFLEHGEREAAEWSYAELDQRARALAARLQALGAAGQPVLLAYPPGLEFVAAFCACLYAGAIAVPVPSPLPGRISPRTAAIAAEVRPRWVLTASPLLDNPASWPGLPPGLAEAAWLATDVLPVHGAEHWSPPVLDGQSLAFVQFTSGSIQAPKGVAIGHANLLANLDMIRAAFGHDAETRVVNWLPLSHDMGLVGGVLQPLFVGGRTVLMSPLDFMQKPARWLSAISRYRATSSGGPNFAYELSANRIRPDPAGAFDLSGWRVAFCGAEPVRADTLARFAAKFAPAGFQARALFPCYGLAEATLFVSGGPKDRGVRTIDVSTDTTTGAPRSAVGCGLGGGPGQRIAIVDPGTGILVPPGQTGEIWVAGPHVGRGYWGRPEETQAVFNARIAGVDGPYLRTGDLGFIADGELFIAGRLKDVMIVRGIKHHPEDIETTVARSHPALACGGGAAFAVATGEGEQVVVLQEVTRPVPAHADLAALAQAAFKAVCEAHGVRPYELRLLRPGALPRTPSHKVQRHLCRIEYQADRLQTLWTLSGQRRTDALGGP
ncbi:fatty acyl-AMP ligase [Methylomagnum ishizawai]|uniref:fatty acyl-AMP ligase n=1 Tax=Methylomagnum ishizawai TaxID=1760988 RepID=UPI001C32D216|nr:fatty acyl-AMP ligase [Methylomagnum ishizawai]BBL76689.1 acyl-CoA synthetase [Methylomagnum ishizawai]